MVTITEAWLDPAGERPLLSALPKSSGLVSALEGSHRGLLSTQASGDATSRAFSALQDKERTLDVVHDRKTRGGYMVLTAYADGSDDPTLASECRALRDRIYPHGVDVVTWSYIDEAGEVRLSDARLTPEDRALLGRLPFDNGTLLDVHNARVAAGVELGMLECERATLTTKDPNMPTRADVVRARNRWIRTVNAFLAALGLEEGLSDDDREKILGPLRRAQQKAND